MLIDRGLISLFSGADSLGTNQNVAVMPAHNDKSHAMWERALWNTLFINVSTFEVRMMQTSAWVSDVLLFLDTCGLCCVQYISESLALRADSDWKAIVMCRRPFLEPSIDLLASCMGRCKVLYFRRAHALANTGTVARPLTQYPVLSSGLSWCERGTRCTIAMQQLFFWNIQLVASTHAVQYSSGMDAISFAL